MTHRNAQALGPLTSKEALTDDAVAILIIDAAPEPLAQTLSLFSEVSHHPTSLWISLPAESAARRLLDERGQFTLALLTARQGAIAHACASPHPNPVPGLQLYRGAENYLALPDALSNSFCRVTASHTVGSHQLYLAAIEAGDRETRSFVQRHLLLSDLGSSQ